MISACPTQTVIVAGASRGIGRAVSVRLARAGHAMLLLSRTISQLDETSLRCARGSSVTSLEVDVRSEADVSKIDTALALLPPLHAVVINAGMGIWDPIDETSVDDWDAQLETNLRGAFLVVRQTLPLLREQGHGLYVIVASDSALVGMSDRSAYTVSKHGLVGLALALRAELAGSTIATSIVYPGKTDTHFRDHVPGDRPGALAPSAVADLIAYVVGAYPQMVVSDATVVPAGTCVSGARSLP